MPTVPKGLGSVSDLMKRFNSANELYNLWRSLHQEAYDFSAPGRETFRFHSPGQNKNRQVFDSTAVIGLQKFANRIQAALIPAWMDWGELVSGSDVPEDEKENVNKDLEEITKTVFASLNHSNFYTEITPALVDYGIGTGGILIEEGDFDTDEAMRFTNVPLAELYVEKPAGGPIKNAWRRQMIKPSQIKELWPEAELPQELEKLSKKIDSKEVEILNGNLFNKEDGRYHQVIIYQPEKALLFTQNFATKRLVVFRGHVTPGEAYGRGPIIQMLADIRTVNKVKEFILGNAAIQMAGVYTGVDDGVFNPHTVRIAPGSIIPVGSNASANPSLSALPRAGDLGLGDIILSDLQDDIKKALFVDPLGEIQDAVRSATEQMLRSQENLKDAGASFGRLKSELVEPIIAAIVDIQGELGKIPKLKVDGSEVTLKFSSPLAKAEDVEDFQNSQLWFQSISQLPPEIVAATVKVEDLPKYWQEKLGVPASLIRSKEETKQVSQVIQSAAEEQIQGGPQEPTAPSEPV